MFTPFRVHAEDEGSSSLKRDWGLNNVGPGAACLNEVAKASTACDFTKNQKLNSAAGFAQQAVLAVSQLLNNKAKSATLAGQCDGVAQSAASVSLALGAFTTYCSVQYLQCQTACERSSKEMSDITSGNGSAATLDGIDISQRARDVGEAKGDCAKLQNNIAAAKNQFSKYLELKNSMANCKSLTANSLEAKCKANPSDAMCALLGSNGDPNDCNSPAGKANQVCICQANPNLPSCGGQLAATGGGGKSNYNDGLDGVDSNLAGNFGADSLGGGNYGDPIPMGAISPTGGGSQHAAQGGSGGGRGGFGGGSGAPKVPGAKGGVPGGGSGLNTKILSGFASAQGGAGGYRPGGGGYDSPTTGAGGATGSGNAAVDLKKFLPGGQMDPARGIAGISGPDGLTGPNSNLWEKVNIRYQEFSAKLLP